ncbi:MAG: helix-turn-helix domain-containing protein, partial [Bacteroidales bacterium]|nr:helix-turn-helix domain-containing protein [Bacteroidales bacterium]
MEHVFAQRLINARKIRGLSQRELCSLLDGQISTNAIAKYETGKMLP